MKWCSMQKSKGGGVALEGGRVFLVGKKETW